MTTAADAAVFDAERHRLIGIAYRMVADVAAAEDIVQDAYLRWSSSERSDVESPAAYLTTIVTRLALDRLRSARVRRESYVGPWLAEPVFAERASADAGPDDVVTLAESVTMGFLRLLDTLSPVERAVFLLHEVFEYRFAEIAVVVDRSEAASRQIATRARRKLAAHADGRPRRASHAVEARTVAAFAEALASGDVERVRAVLCADVVATSDGGGVRHAAVRPVIGADRVSRYLIGIARKAPPDARVEFAEVNREPAFVVWFGDSLEMVVTVGVTDEGIGHLHAVRNPHKLGAISAGYELVI